ncbi:MAG: acyl-CoA desaturase [Bacteroidetes bacterium]|nr:acyl-CoA desaturase [Bacteroidota bacterium]
MVYDSIKFDKKADADFFLALRNRVADYFTSNNITRYGNWEMKLKTVFMFCLLLIPYGIMISGAVTNKWLFLLLWIIMGLGISGIGFSIMHDANHGAYSKNKGVNYLLGLCINFVGGFAVTWKIQHNKFHHTYTNIQGMDEDISRVKILRFSPNAEWMKMHQFQHFYAWFLYGLMTLSWAISKDFIQLRQYSKRGLTNSYGSFKSLLAGIILWKVVFYAYILVLPMILSPFSPWFVLLCFLIMHYVAGLTLSTVFQSAHVMPEVEFPLPNEEGKIENNWAVHQMLTTSNFSPSSSFFSWFIGGLNYQVEHHLFPNICHVHYRKISKIVQKTAEEYEVPYHSHKYFLKALWLHAKLLKELGKKDSVQPLTA